MKIAIITAGISTKSGLRVPIELAKAFAKNNHQVFFYALSKGKDQKIIIELRKMKVTIHLIRNSNPTSEMLSLRKKILNDNPDIVSAHCFTSQLFAAWLTGIPTIWTYYGTQLNVVREHTFPTQSVWIPIADKLINQYIKLKIWLMILISDKIIAISLATAKELKNLYGKKTIATISLGSIPNLFTNLKQKTKVPNKQTAILSVSRITPYKGFHKIIKIINNLSKKNPNLKLIIVGSTPIPKYLSYLKSIAGKNITFKLNISDQQLAQLYKNADIYITADKYLFYGLPIWEASSFSLPTVAIDYQATSEAVIHSKTGLLAKNQKQLEKNLEKLIQNPKLRQRLGKNAKTLASQHTWKKTAQQYEKLFQTTLTN